MQALIEQLHAKRALLVIGPSADRSDEVWSTCQALAQLPFVRVLSLANDGAALIDTWRHAGRLIDVLQPSAGEAPAIDDRRVAWLSLPAASQEPPWLAPLLRTWFAAHAVCFVGCDLDDAGFRQRVRAWTDTVGLHRPPCFALVERDLAAGDRRNWEAHNITFQVAHPAAWARSLAAAWRDAVVTPGPALVAQQAPFTGSPYPFLDSFAEQDAGRFFGRDDAIRDLGELVLAEQLVVCFGPSGVGKSSLLQAGLAPRLRQQGCLPLYCRPESDPVASIRRSALAQGDHAPAGASLAEMLAGLVRQEQRTVVVLLDQFEEVFTLLGEETAGGLAAELAACLRLPSGPVHAVLALREDYLARLHALQPALPRVFDHRFRLRPLTRAEARQAITAPAELAGLGYEPALADRLLADLGRDDAVEPADVQIVCHALYQDLQASGDSTFRLARYQELGAAASLLAGYLEQVVDDEPAPDQVRDVLKAMVTAQGTRTVLAPGEIAFLAGLDPGTARAILQRLDRPHRLARPVQREDGVHYELAHEVLGPRILAWVTDPLEREARAAHDLLRSERHNWQQFDALPGPGKLQAVYAQRDNPFLRLSAADLEMIAQAALRYDAEAAYWLARAETSGVPAGDFLLPALSSPRPEVRELAARLLGPAAAAELDRLLRGSPAPDARANAAMTLGALASGAGWSPLRRARHDPDETVRAAVWQGLEALDEAAAGRLRRRDEALPLLLAGSLAYWAVVALAGMQGLLTASWPAWALAGALWLVALVVSGWLVPGLQTIGRRLLGSVLALASSWLLVFTWGWIRGLIVLLVVILGLRGKVYLLAAAALGYLALLVLVAPTPDVFLGVTGASILGLAALTLTVPRWRGSSLDRAAALAALGAGLGALAAGLLLTRSSAAAAAELLLLACGVAVVRWVARRPLVYSGGSQGLETLLDIGRILWDVLDQISFNLKSLVSGIAGAVWAAVLIGAAAALSPGSRPAWTIIDALLLGAGLGVGLWWSGRGGLLRAALLPALGGALGGALAHGLPGAVAGACIGVGLGVGEWLGARYTSTASEPGEIPEG